MASGSSTPATIWPAHFAYTGFAWYPRHFDFVPASGVPLKMDLFVPPVNDAYEVYWNDALVGHFSKLPPHPAWYALQPHTFGQGIPQSGVLVIRPLLAPELVPPV